MTKRKCCCFNMFECLDSNTIINIMSFVLPLCGFAYCMSCLQFVCKAFQKTIASSYMGRSMCHSEMLDPTPFWLYPYQHLKHLTFTPQSDNMKLFLASRLRSFDTLNVYVFLYDSPDVDLSFVTHVTTLRFILPKYNSKQEHNTMPKIQLPKHVTRIKIVNDYKKLACLKIEDFISNSQIEVMDFCSLHMQYSNSWTNLIRANADTLHHIIITSRDYDHLLQCTNLIDALKLCNIQILERDDRWFRNEDNPIFDIRWCTTLQWLDLRNMAAHPSKLSQTIRIIMSHAQKESVRILWNPSSLKVETKIKHPSKYDR